MALVFGMMVIGCDNGTTGGGGDSGITDSGRDSRLVLEIGYAWVIDVFAYVFKADDTFSRFLS